MTTLNELIEAFKEGKLKEEDGDFLLYDKRKIELHTEKEGYNFSMDAADIAFDLLGKMGIFGESA